MKQGVGINLAIVFLVMFFLFVIGSAFMFYMRGEGHFAARMLKRSKAQCFCESSIAEARLEISESIKNQGEWYQLLQLSSEILKTKTIQIIPQYTNQIISKMYQNKPDYKAEITVSFPQIINTGKNSFGILKISAITFFGEITKKIEVNLDFKITDKSFDSYKDLYAQNISFFHRTLQRLTDSQYSGKITGLNLVNSYLSESIKRQKFYGNGILFFLRDLKIIETDNAPEKLISLSSSIINYRDVKN